MSARDYCIQRAIDKFCSLQHLQGEEHFLAYVSSNGIGEVYHSMLSFPLVRALLQEGEIGQEALHGFALSRLESSGVEFEDLSGFKPSLARLENWGHAHGSSESAYRSLTDLEPDTSNSLPDEFLLDVPEVTEETDQGNIGSCGAWATAHTVEVVHAIARDDDGFRANPSVGYAIIKDKGLDPWPEQHGTTMQALTQLALGHGWAEWGEWEVHRDAEEGNPGNLPLPSRLYRKCARNKAGEVFAIDEWNEDTVDAIQRAIIGHYRRSPVRGVPICAGFQVFRSSIFNAYTKTTGVVGMPLKDELPMGGHAVCVIGWKRIKGERYFVIKNSWGLDFGDNGKLYLPFEYAFQYFLPSWTLNRMEHEPSRSNSPDPIEEGAKPSALAFLSSSVLLALFVIAGWFAYQSARLVAEPEGSLAGYRDANRPEVLQNTELGGHAPIRSELVTDLPKSAKPEDALDAYQATADKITAYLERNHRHVNMVNEGK